MNDLSEVGHLVSQLNDAQKDAVTAPPEHRLVLAGAGSGKTRVLVHRIAWLIAVENVSPLSILAVTFTNKAANEMRGRIESLLAVPVRQLWVGTFHGIAHRMLRLHWKEATLRQDFQILDADDAQRLVKRIIKQLDLPEDQWPAKMVANWISSQKEEGRRPHHFDDMGDFTQRALVRVYSAYHATCEQQGLVDFSELLLRAYELCRDDANVQAHYRRKFRHVLVDEFQDTNTLQYLWLKLLVGEQGVLFAVGDDDQSVYGWRGAKVENMMKLQREFRGLEIVRLEQNYRSTGTILKAANGLIERNSGRLGKNLWTDGHEGAPIQLYAAFNEYDEAEFVVQRMKEHINGPLRHSDLAVLYRTGAQSRVMEEMLIRARMPYRIYGGLRFFERMEVKDALAWLRLIHNRDDDVSFERALATPPHGVGATSIEKLRSAAREAGVSLWAASRRDPALLGRTAGAMNKFLDQVDRLGVEAKDQLLPRVMEDVITGSGLREHYQKEKGEQAEGRLENLDELISAARSFERPDEDGVEPVSAFLAHAALEAGEGQAAAGEDSVQLMTLHAAKGLEFPVVFIVGLENNLFPSMRAVEEGNLEEERRLCYVGITRARQQLYLSYAEVRRIHGVEQIGMPSPFLKEIPQETLMETRPRAGILRPSSFGGGRDAPRYGNGGYGGGGSNSSGGGYTPPPRRIAGASAPDYGGFKLGQRVSHAKFGEGVILSFEGEGERAQIEIRFREAGIKRLMLGFAKLQAM
ncbi:DNA helicase II [Hydrocarboniphaga sp.]|uniref:DNA helicase II n=1 Tax=Hydrocarboniphaga sp. TaxID=2033016 RepID=UPI003D0EAD27